MHNESMAADAHLTLVRKQPEPMIASIHSAPDEQPSVVLISDHGLAFEGLKTLLIKHRFDVVGAGRRLRDIDLPMELGMSRLLVIFDVIDVGDLYMDDMVLFRDDYPNACFVVLLDNFQKTVGSLPADIGANAIIDKNIACDALIKALNVVMAGYGVLSPIIKSEVDAETPGRLGEASKNTMSSVAATSVPSTLSDRELQIIGCIAEGHSNKVIARRYSISEATVKIHVRSILRKIDARNRTQAAIWAVHHGFGSSALPLD